MASAEWSGRRGRVLAVSCYAPTLFVVAVAGGDRGLRHRACSRRRRLLGQLGLYPHGPRLLLSLRPLPPRKSRPGRTTRTAARFSSARSRLGEVFLLLQPDEHRIPRRRLRPSRRRLADVIDPIFVLFEEQAAGRRRSSRKVASSAAFWLVQRETLLLSINFVFFLWWRPRRTSIVVTGVMRAGRRLETLRKLRLFAGAVILSELASAVHGRRRCWCGSSTSSRLALAIVLFQARAVGVLLAYWLSLWSRSRADLWGLKRGRKSVWFCRSRLEGPPPPSVIGTG